MSEEIKEKVWKNTKLKELMSDIYFKNNPIPPQFINDIMDLAVKETAKEYEEREEKAEASFDRLLKEKLENQAKEIFEKIEKRIKELNERLDDFTLPTTYGFSIQARIEELKNIVENLKKEFLK